MKKYKLFAAVALLVLPAMLISNPGYSTSRLPEISAVTGATGQQNCPVERRYGCFGPAYQTGGAGMVNSAYGSTAGAGSSPFMSCLQFLMQFRNFRIGQG